MLQSLRAGRASLQVLASVALALSVAACAPATSEHLSDDPTREQTPAQPNKPTDANSGSHSIANNGGFTDVNPVDTPDASAILQKYSYLDPDHLVPRNLLAAALTYFDANPTIIRNKNYISVIDFALPSSKRRFFIIDMTTGSVFATTSAHGKGSDVKNDGYAETFSNVNNSEASSLGVYLTAETYFGAHGLSLRLDGMSSTNSNVRLRQVVVHGADYVQDREVTQGRSWGCPAVPMEYRDRIVGWIKGGSVIYANLSTK